MKSRKPGRGGAVRTALAVASFVLAAGASAAPPVQVEDLPTGLAKSATAGLPAASVAQLVAEDGKAHVAVIFRDEPAALVWSDRRAAGASVALAQLEANRAVQAMSATQQAYLASLVQRGVDFEPVYALQRTLNATVIRIAPDDLEALRNDPAVERVEFVPLHEPTHTTSVPFIGAPQAWGNTIGLPAGVTGQGMRIGIIDTGIDYHHPVFGGTGALADYSANDRTVITDQIGGNPIFPTAKVVGGWDFAGDAYNGGAAAPTPDPDPMDCNGHGTHVAGTAAGLGVTAAGAAYAGPWDAVTDYSGLRIGPGVAPQAQLYALRVFGCGGSTALTALAIERAADPNQDGDFSDRLDVVNMSLGSNFGLPFDLTSVTADNAATTGMVVVASAGNAGETYFISGSPGAGSRVISVANSVDAGVNAVLLEATAPLAVAAKYPAAPSSYTDANTVPQPAGENGPLTLVNDGVSGSPGGSASDACEALTPGSLTGQVALVDRGFCAFTVKVVNVQNAGAIAAVIANNVVGDPIPAGLGGSTASDITIPALAVPQATGALLRSAAGVSVTLRTTNASDTMSSSSSRGPRGGGGPRFLKSELAAPGTSITSAQTGVVCTAAAQGCIVPNGSGFIPDGAALTISGTSMAAPHVAGMMALMRQLNPSRTAEELKAMAMSSSRRNLTIGAESSGSRFPASRVGAGRIDVAHALSADVFVGLDATDGAVAAVWDADVTAAGSEQRSVRVVNRKAIPQNVTLEIDTVLDAPGVSFALVGASTRTIPPGGSILVPVQMTVDPASMDRNRDPSISAVQSVTAPAALANLGPLPRHYLTEESALLLVKKAGNEIGRVPLYAAVRPHGTLASQTALFQLPATGTANLTLAGTSVCTGAPNGGVCDLPLPATDRASLVSPFELQIQAAVDGAAPAYASVRFAGVNYSAEADQFYFGVASHGEWSTPGNVAYNICVDNNEDGTFDRVLFSADLGNLSRIFGQNASGTDVFMNGVFSLPGSVSLGGPTAFVNMVNAQGVDAPLHDNSVMVLAATAVQLGLGAGDRKFRYAVSTCPGFNPLCVRLTVPTACSGSTFQQVPMVATYDGLARGITSSGGVGSLPVLVPVQSGSTLPIDYNLTNLAANGSTGVLLLHHHNTEATRAQAVTFSIPPVAIGASGSAAPSAAGRTESTLLTVQVTPGAQPVSTGITVRADLSALGGSATQALLDDGVPPDAAGGDGIYSFQATVGPASAIGSSPITATVQDVEGRTTNAQIAFEVLAATAPTASGTATPAAVPSGVDTVLAVTVTPGANPPSTGIAVTVDLGAVGGSTTQALRDDGVAPDASAGDGIYSASVTITGTPGDYVLPATVTDAQARTAQATIDLQILPPLEELIFEDGFEGS